MPRDFDLSVWDKAIVASAALLFLSSAALYVSGFSLRRYFYGEDTLSQQRQIGVVVDSQGELKRELFGDPEFRAVPKRAPLYNEDTVITGHGASAKLQLDDESTIELGPDTMIKLSFGTEAALGGISRPTTVEVVTGKVATASKKKEIILKTPDKKIMVVKETRQEIVAVLPKTLVMPKTPLPPVAVAPAAEIFAKPQEVAVKAEVAAPPPPPVPTAAPIVDAKVSLLQPAKGAQVAPVLSDGTALADVRFRWNVDPAPEQVTFHLMRGTQEVAKQTVEMKGKSEGGLRFAVKKPGAYQWRIESAAENAKIKPFQTSSSFVVANQVEGIQFDDVLVAGEKRSDNRYSGKKTGDFSLALRWHEVSGATAYVVKISANPDGSGPLFSKQTSDPELTLSAEQAKTLQKATHAYYRVTAPLKSGFTVVSPAKDLGFRFVPPQPVSPADGKQFSLAQLKADQGRVLFTWQKTNFTDAYELELSKDPEFRQLFVKRRLSDNFLILKFANPGEFWWRVRAYQGEVAGQTSSPIRMSIGP